jgi:hypothetical protein
LTGSLATFFRSANQAHPTLDEPSDARCATGGRASRQSATPSPLPILRDRREAVLKRIADFGLQLRETFNELPILEYRRSFEECVEIVKSTLSNLES